MIGIIACLVVSLVISVIALLVLQRLVRRRSRSRRWYLAAQWIGTPVLAAVAVLPAMLCVGAAWAVFVSGPIVLAPFVAWNVAGVRRAPRRTSPVGRDSSAP